VTSALSKHPEVYGVLLAPGPEEVEAWWSWIFAHLEGDCGSVMDPACGPANVLLPFARDGLHVAGNDLEPAMVRHAREVLAPFGAEVTCGDMRSLRLRTKPFDVALNLYASIGHLEDDAGVRRHLACVARHLRPGGLYLLGLNVADGGEASEDVIPLFESSPTALPGGGMVSVRYDSVHRDPALRIETVQSLLVSQGVPGLEPVSVHEYSLRTFPVAVVGEFVADPAWELAAVYQMGIDGWPEVDLKADLGDATLALRRTAALPRCVRSG
jgi:SAM-dependent methyltransferase